MPCWVDGKIVAASDVALSPDSAWSEGRGVYTTARVHRGQVVWSARHGRRLSRQAGMLGLPALESQRVEDALAELAAAAFPGDDGVVRLQASAVGKPERLRLVGIPRSLGSDPAQWRVTASEVCHPGPSVYPGAKLSGAPFLGEARRRLSESDFDEALLFDRNGRLVEGSRSTIVVVTSDGCLVVPDASLGGVESVTREVTMELDLGLECAEINDPVLAQAREVIALNAARGARAIVAIDKQPVGTGKPGPAHQRLADALRGAGFPIP